MTNPMTIPTLAFQQVMTLMTMMSVQRGTPLLATHTTSVVRRSALDMGTAHHIIGLAQGGDPLDPANLTPAHRGCNTAASNRPRGTARMRCAVRRW
jgi:hypothetical protein